MISDKLEVIRVMASRCNGDFAEYKNQEDEWEAIARRIKMRTCTICKNTTKSKAIIRNGEKKHISCMIKAGESIESQEGDTYD
jgi:hypothetical protein